MVNLRSMTDQQSDDEKRVRKAIDDLMEFYDSCQVFVTRHDQATLDGTLTMSMGQGNWFARYGQIRTWVIRQDEKSRQDNTTI